MVVVNGSLSAAQAEGRVRQRSAFAVWPVLLGLVIVLSIVLAIGIGAAHVPPAVTARYLAAALFGGQISADEVTAYQIVWQIRTPRVLLAAVVGAGLATVGVAVQAMVRNALADPFVLGISSGASVGAVTVTVLGALAGLGIAAVSVGAFLGALGASLLVFLSARAAGGSSGVGLSPLRLVLTGVALSFAFQAVMSLIIYFAPNSEATSTVLFWTMGSFGAAGWGSLPVVAAVVIAGIVVIQRLCRTMDVMALGDETAASLGIDAQRGRTLLFVITAVMTGAMVAVSGAIGFVGLIMPHLVRLMVGAGHRRVMIICPLVGAVFMIWVDVLSRTLVAPRELPLGVITALLGVPVFIFLMRRRSYLFGGR